MRTSSSVQILDIFCGMLSMNACHEKCVETVDIVCFIKKTFFTELYLYRYANAEAILRAVGDFLKGPGKA